ncbi:acyl-CoA dehydrogenase family protein [Nocardioides insulae]|uniref:acyl-CoA dehydrogenase family protein n=1 Tax=Nocardioides insulae TaxID=394734 RepID=UPI0004251946|nr:acyl-CoA dehydrogenase family protein [Nocardioides insulae]
MTTIDTPVSIAEVDPDLIATMREVLSSSAPTPRDPDTGVEFDQALWDQLDELGLARLTGSEESGGSGAGWAESAALLTQAASLAVALPLAEHDLLAGWLLTSAGLPVDADLRSVAVLDADGSARAVPWAPVVSRIVLAWPAGDGGWRVADVPATSVKLTADTNLAGEPRGEITATLDDSEGVPVPEDLIRRLQLRAALVRAVQVAGALERTLDLVTEHVTTRVQFGRPIGKFQAVQHLVADIAAETSLARAAVDAAVRTVATPDVDLAELRFRVAVARSCAGHAASVVVRNSHQALGAIGTTLEHDLHRFTLPALAWRAEYGSTASWDRVVADSALSVGSDGLWELIAG